ncbi:hypothetical protein [Candidatus Formimonas warabiya]|nr:hypothetical protein [Candidatus Formimonas warabiya]
MEKNTCKKPWSIPQIVEIAMMKTEHGGGYDGFDIAFQDASEDPIVTGS